MKEKTVPEKTIVIDIGLTRGLIVALSCVLMAAALLAYLTLAGESAVASGTETTLAQSTGMRQFYQTQSTFKGNEALTACGSGYHFASIWEIADPSNLKYNTSLGFMRSDSGQGPPSGDGWVRTGYAQNAANSVGIANCSTWTSASVSDYGSKATLVSYWTTGAQDVGVWNTTAASCAVGFQVWCIED